MTANFFIAPAPKLCYASPMQVMERVFKIIGGKAVLAKELGLHRQQVDTWDVPPVKYVRRISAMTGGRVSEVQLLKAILNKKAV